MVESPDNVSKSAAVAAILVCLGFAAYTRHAWEDYLITFRASLNLATGHGLVFQSGERVHSFTSPLGTLLPALFAAGDGPRVEFRALWWYRLTSVLALGFALWLAAREFTKDGLVAPAACIACGLWVFDPKIVDFTINGMESALLILFIVLTWRAFVRGGKLWPTALGFAGLQWTRPDGFIFFGALMIPWFVLAKKSKDDPNQKSWRKIVRAVALGTMVYLPWIVFAWVYYGSPIPHTILAKQFHHPLDGTAINLLLYPLRLLGGHVALHDIFMPAYFYFGGWPLGLAWFARLLGTGAALAWLWPAVKPAGRIASAALFLGGFYLEYIPGSPWYFPGWQVMACIAWGYLLDAARSRETRIGSLQPILPPLPRIIGLLLVATQFVLLIAVAWQMRNQQTIIESNHRQKIGVWLKAHASTGDRVYLEPLGYIGFYSQLKMLDNPGLSSPEVVAARQAGHTTHAQIIQALKPDWLVLRPDQVEAVNASAPRLLLQDYRLATIFDTRAQIDAVSVLPGRGYLDFDARFLIYAKASADSSNDGR